MVIYTRQTTGSCTQLFRSQSLFLSPGQIQRPIETIQYISLLSPFDVLLLSVFIQNISLWASFYQAVTTSHRLSQSRIVLMKRGNLDLLHHIVLQLHSPYYVFRQQFCVPRSSLRVCLICPTYGRPKGHPTCKSHRLIAAYKFPNRIFFPIVRMIE